MASRQTRVEENSCSKRLDKLEKLDLFYRKPKFSFNEYFTHLL